ncbi:MAG: tetratricopeptide repeat protein [Flavobacteriales bacterium]
MKFFQVFILICWFATSTVMCRAQNNTGRDTLLILIQEHYDHGRFEEAINLCGKVIEADSTDIETLMLRGIMYDFTNAYEAALKDYTTVLQIDPMNVDARMNRPMIWNELMEYDSAMADYNFMLKHGMADDEVLLAQAFNLYDSGNWYEAVNAVNNAIEFDSTYAPAFLMRASIWDEIGEYRLAVFDYEKFKLIGQPNQYQYLSIGVCKVNAGMYAQAQPDLEMCMKLGGDSTYACYELGRSCIGLEEFKKAMQWLQVSVRHNPEFADAHAQLGIAYRRLGETNKAIEAFKTSIDINESVDVIFEMALALWDDEQIDEALKLVTVAIENNTLHIAEAYCLRGRCHAEKEQYAKAILDYTMSLDHIPGHITTLQMRAEAYELKADKHADNKGKKEARIGYELALADLYQIESIEMNSNGTAKSIERIEKKLKRLD